MSCSWLLPHRVFPVKCLACSSSDRFFDPVLNAKGVDTNIFPGMSTKFQGSTRRTIPYWRCTDSDASLGENTWVRLPGEKTMNAFVQLLLDTRLCSPYRSSICLSTFHRPSRNKETDRVIHREQQQRQQQQQRVASRKPI